MDKRQICIKFAREVSAILKIAAPAIRFVPVKQLRTSTQIAALTPDGILIRNDIGVTPELFFAIAHELRHAYQLENDRSLHDYRTSEQLDIDEYNAQPLDESGEVSDPLVFINLIDSGGSWKGTYSELADRLGVGVAE